MRRAKTIDEIHMEIKDYDLIITNDAPLATALSGRIDVPYIGYKVCTPMQIASMEVVGIYGRMILNDLEIVREISKERDYSLKTIHSEVENIRMIRKYTQNVRKYLHSKASRNVMDSFERLLTLERVMGEYVPEERDFYKGKKVAVIGVDFFNDLDKHFIPIDHDEVDMFSGEKAIIPTIYEMGNDRQIAGNIVSLITDDIVEDVAIVMDVNGPIADAIRAELYRRDIPFKNSVSVKDISQIRDYLRFISLALDYETLKVADVKEIFSNYGGYFGIRYDEYFLSRHAKALEGRSQDLSELMRDIRGLTFEDVSTRLANHDQSNGKVRSLIQVNMLLEDLGISKSMVTRTNLNEITYAVNNVGDLHHNEQIPDDEKRGVLLADCSRSVYVDRSIVLFVGLGLEWSSDRQKLDYVDRELESEIEAYKLAILLQQGSSRVYAVNTMRRGKKAAPSPVFEKMHEVFGERMQIHGFEDVCNNLVKGQWNSMQEVEFSHKAEVHVDDSAMDDWMFTKSSLNQYYACPRAYFFSELIPYSDSDKTMFGNILHEFAEFYLCYPEIIKREGLDAYLASLNEEYAGLSCEQMRIVDESRMKVGMNNIIELLDMLNIKDVPLDKLNSDRKYKNRFMERHNLEFYSSMTETGMSSNACKLYGSMDLFNGDSIFDYKTGKPSSMKDIAENMDFTEDRTYYEFQPLIYLHLLENQFNIAGSFNLVFLLDNKYDSVENDFDIRRNIKSIKYDASTLNEFLSRNDCPIRRAMPKSTKEYCDKWDDSIQYLISRGLDSISDWYMDEDVKIGLIQKVGYKVNKDQKKNAGAFIDNIMKHMNAPIFRNGDGIWIKESTMEDFLDRVNDLHREATRFRSSQFPPRPRRGCDKCNYQAYCTKEVIMEGGEGSE